MKKYIYFVLLILLPALVITNFKWHFFDKIASKIVKTETGFAVVEAFTSEGCSSCPPAYEVIEKIENEALSSNNHVFILDFHVDHWDHLGWKDPFSEAQYSDRQREYSRVIGPDYLYTPQMIINGQEEFIGSQENKAKEGVSKALSSSLAALNINLKESDIKVQDSIVILYDVSEIPQNTTLNFALTENSITSKVLAGENEGKTLVHKNVVRRFISIPFEAKKGIMKIPSLSQYSQSGYKITCFVQNTQNMKIVAANGIDLKKQLAAK